MHVPVILLPVGADTWCLPVADVLEVVVAPTARPVPTARQAALGVFNLRGDVVPLFDTAQLLGLPASEVAHAVVVRHAGGRVALSTSSVPRTATLTAAGTPASHPAALTEHRLGDDSVVLLDPAELWER